MKALKILFADDDLKYSMLLKRFLEAEGYEVTYAGNGRIALEQFPAVKPDLVLLDINMPELNGFEVAEHIRALDRNVLLFFLSDRSDKADRLKGFDLRANDYLAKPFYPEELLARIRERFQCGDDVVQTEMYSFGNTVFNYTTNEIRTGNNKTLITSRQAEILRMLAKNVNVSVDRDSLLNKVWGASSYANSLALNVQVCQMYGVCRNQLSGHVKMRSNHDILSCGNVAETNQLLYRFTHIESTDIEWCMFIIGTRHISYFRQISRQVVNLKHGVLQHFVHSGLICAHGFIVEEGNTHFQCLHRTFQLMYHRVHKTLPHFIYLPLFQYRLDLVDKAADEHQHQQDASGELPHHLLK